MSRRGWPLFLQGQSVPCRLCGSLIPPGEAVLCLPWAPFPKWEPMANFESMSCHPTCWERWQFRERFVELFNRYAGDAVLDAGGGVAYLGADGEVVERQDRIRVR